MKQNQAQDEVLDYCEVANLIAESSVQSRLDLGHSFVYRVSHPVRGNIIVVSSFAGNGAVLGADV